MHSLIDQCAVVVLSMGRAGAPQASGSVACKTSRLSLDLQDRGQALSPVEHYPFQVACKPRARFRDQI